MRGTLRGTGRLYSCRNMTFGPGFTRLTHYFSPRDVAMTPLTLLASRDNHLVHALSRQGEGVRGCPGIDRRGRHRVYFTFAGGGGWRECCLYGARELQIAGPTTAGSRRRCSRNCSKLMASNNSHGAIDGAEETETGDKEASGTEKLDGVDTDAEVGGTSARPAGGLAKASLWSMCSDHYPPMV